jgi:hypothetical protein
VKKPQKHFTPEEKLHLKEAFCWSRCRCRSCDKQDFQPTIFCRWQKELFDNFAAA